MCPNHADHFLPKQRKKRRTGDEVLLEKEPYSVVLERDDEPEFVKIGETKHPLPEKTVILNFVDVIIK